MPRNPRTTPPEDPAPDPAAGAPAPEEGPPMPGAPLDAEPEEDKTVADMRAEAEARGVLPEEGSGSGGRVIRADLEAALEGAPPEPPAGRPPLSAVAEQAAAQIMPREGEE
jgi:pyruvate/2-oxoglutarate dehydrogenase complex dihydrolipoamide acyltransferase (E2) component